MVVVSIGYWPLFLVVVVGDGCLWLLLLVFVSGDFLVVVVDSDF